MIISVYILIIASLLLFPDVCAYAARNALSVWGLHVVPSLFPYMVLCKMLAKRIHLTRFSPTAACALLGAAGGSPSGAAVIAALSAALPARVVRPLCAFTGVISPMFFLGTVSSWTADATLAIKLFVSQLAGSFFASAMVFFFQKRSEGPASCIVTGNDDSPLTQSIDAILQIGGCILCFSVLAGLLGVIALPKQIIAVIHALLEISGGLHAVMHAWPANNTQRVLLAALSGFGGFSILFQNLHFLKPIGISACFLLGASGLRALFAALVMFLLQQV